MRPSAGTIVAGRSSRARPCWPWSCAPGRVSAPWTEGWRGLCPRDQAGGGPNPLGPSRWRSLQADASLLCHRHVRVPRARPLPIPAHHPGPAPPRGPRPPPPGAGRPRGGPGHPKLCTLRGQRGLRDPVWPRLASLTPAPASAGPRSLTIPLQVHGGRGHCGLQLAGTPGWEIRSEAGGEGARPPGVQGGRLGPCSC